MEVRRILRAFGLGELRVGIVGTVGLPRFLDKESNLSFYTDISSNITLFETRITS